MHHHTQPDLIQEEVQSRRASFVSRQSTIKVSKDINQKVKFDALNDKQIWAFSQGHFQNDLLGAIWFNFLPFYLVSILGKGHIAPLTLLIGQVFDGFMSPLVGTLCDETQTKYGSKIPWYFGGTLMTLISTIPMYIVQLPDKVPDWLDYTYYILFPVLQNLGGATVMIVHMSFVPAVTCSRKRRDFINAKRNTFSFIGNFFILILSLIIFQLTDNGVSSFRWIAGISLIIGTVSSVYFLLNIDEPKLAEACKQCVINIKKQLNQVKKPFSRFKPTPTPDPESHMQQLEEEEEHESKVHWKVWFKEVLFYQIGCIYMLARLYFNIVSIMILFYVVHTLKIIENPEDLSKKQMPFDVAFIPLLIWIGSVGASSIIDKLYIKYGRKNTYSLGMVIVVITSLCYYTLTPDTRSLIYIVALITGMTQAIVLTTGITLIGEVVGNRGQSSAFVYGMYCFLDKTLTGIVLYIVCEQHFTSEYLRNIMTYLPFYTALLVWFLLLATKLSYEKEIQGDDKEQPLLAEADDIKQLKEEFVQ